VDNAALLGLYLRGTPVRLLGIIQVRDQAARRFVQRPKGLLKLTEFDGNGLGNLPQAASRLVHHGPQLFRQFFGAGRS
jgi:hypothetical protein